MGRDTLKQILARTPSAKVSTRGAAEIRDTEFRQRLREKTVKNETTAKSTQYAIQAAWEIRNIMLDPTSFAILRVIAITKLEKDGRTSFKGCVHYVGTNSYGGKRQSWGGYSVNKKGQLHSWPGSEDGDCYIFKNESQTDVTTEVEKFLSEHKPS